LPAPRGEGSESLHFDSEENDRIWVSPSASGHWILHEVLTSHSETKNGEPDEDPELAALRGVDVAMDLGHDGKWAAAVNPLGVIGELAANGPDAAEHVKPDELESYSNELRRDWQLGAEIYLDQPVFPNVPIYSLMSVSLPQLHSHYVVVAEVFGEASDGPEHTPWATGTEAIFGRRDPRWGAARAALAPLLMQLGVKDDEILEDFAGSGTETIDLQSLQVYQSSYSGNGIFPFPTQRGTFPLRFEIEEVAGAEAAPDLPPTHLDPMHSVDARPTP
jgi:hypothetical protein